jgi:hypothetical protein
MRFAVLAITAFVGCSNADEPASCKTSKPKSFSFGVVSRTECTYKDGSTQDSINFQGNPILRDVRLFPDDSSPDKSIRIYTSGANSKTSCAGGLYLVDFNVKPPKVLAFGVKKACNEFHWASWGAKRSVIAIKNNVSFVYENGKLAPPPSGEKLWSSIEPPHAGAGLAVEDAVGFVEELSLPK